ncbi:hypothetical protein S922_16035 [Salmonella enterica subsp. enterica]|nr:hypothetical protein [Salmonella enterica subsp. enterica]EAW9772792.1 hypothetical protein [Salmonella enterica]
MFTAFRFDLKMKIVPVLDCFLQTQPVTSFTLRAVVKIRLVGFAEKQAVLCFPGRPGFFIPEACKMQDFPYTGPLPLATAGYGSSITGPPHICLIEEKS